MTGGPGIENASYEVVINGITIFQRNELGGNRCVIKQVFCVGYGW